MPKITSAVCLKLIGSKLQTDEEFQHIFSTAGFTVEILDTNMLEIAHRPMEMVGQSESNGIGNFYLLEHRSSQEDIQAMIDKIRKYEYPDTAIILITDGNPGMKDIIFAQANSIKLINRRDSADSILENLNCYIHNILMSKEKLRRKNLRLNISFPVVYSHGGYHREATATDISREGIYVITLDPLDNNSTSNVVFSLPGFEKQFDFEVKVLYSIRLQENIKGVVNLSNIPVQESVIHPGMALLFQNTPETEQDAISDFIINKLYY